MAATIDHPTPLEKLIQWSRPVTHAPEAEIVTSAAHLTLTTAASDITFAILFVTKKRPAPLHAFHHARFHGVVAIGRTLRILRRTVCIVIRPVIVRAPLPDIAVHIV